MHVIGHAHYEVTPDGNDYATAFGEDRFHDGEYDVERDKLEMRHDQIPRMVTFEHTFFNANGTLQRVSKADLETGVAACIQYENGQPVVRRTVLQFPPDTFAGAAIVIPLKGYLSPGHKDAIVLHDFNCIPGPEILKVKAYPQPPSEWSQFRGEVVRVDIKPDFGWLNFRGTLRARDSRVVQSVERLAFCRGKFHEVLQRSRNNTRIRWKRSRPEHKIKRLPNCRKHRAI